MGAKENFDDEWVKLVKGTVQVNGAPEMMSPEKEEGWDIISGASHYTDGGRKGFVILMTATGGGKTVSVVLMTNTDKYQEALLSVLNSLKIAAASQAVVAATAEGNGNASVVGLWVRYTIETSGYANGFPQASGGYFRKEYTFYADGTYLFRMKNWAVYVKEIQYVYESGTGSCRGINSLFNRNWGRADGGLNPGAENQ